jgi:hypothetical protein
MLRTRLGSALFSCGVLAFMTAGAMQVFAQCPAENRVFKHIRGTHGRPGIDASLDAHGRRFRAPGQERAVLTGTLITKQIPGGAGVRIVQQLPDLTRVEAQIGPRGKVVAFDGQKGWTDTGAPAKDDTALLESLVSDAPERFFQMQEEPVPIRRLGALFRIDGQVGTTYSGPLYDIYMVLEPAKVKSGGAKTKHYYVNSRTRLMERVAYVDDDNTPVRTIVDSWQDVGQNRVPRVLRRLENGTEVMRITIEAAQFSPAVADRSFCSGQ